MDEPLDLGDDTSGSGTSDPGILGSGPWNGQNSPIGTHELADLTPFGPLLDPLKEGIRHPVP